MFLLQKDFDSLMVQMMIRIYQQYLFKIFLLMWTIFKGFVEFVMILILFYVLVFGLEACGIVAPQPGIEPTPYALKGEILTTREIAICI